jgi:hypothetical protein
MRKSRLTGEQIIDLVKQGGVRGCREGARAQARVRQRRVNFTSGIAASAKAASTP